MFSHYTETGYRESLPGIRQKTLVFGKNTLMAEFRLTKGSQLPQHTLREIGRFFQDYKTLENKQVVIEDFLGPDDALRILQEALDLYRRLRRGELK